MLCERVGVATSIGSKTLSGGKGCATKSIVLLVGVVAVVFPERMLSRLNGSTSKASSSVAKSAAAALTPATVSMRHPRCVGVLLRPVLLLLVAKASLADQ
jgi:hypothetical protein